MRIEVLVGNEDPIVFPLKSSKVSLGSSENCDIVVNADGVSRKHILIITEGDRYFIADQGSTNGSFINEERLIPGRKVELTSFFPVRLGDNVLLSLLSDSDVDPHEDLIVPISIKDVGERTNPKDKTTVISLQSMNKIRTEDLVLERNQKRAIRKNKSKKVEVRKAKPNYIPYIALFIFIAAAVQNFYLKAPAPSEPVVSEVGKIVTIEAPVKEVKVGLNLIPQDELILKESYKDILNNMKCSIDVEIHLCDLIPGARDYPYGVSQVGLTLHVMLDGTPYFEEAKSLIGPAKSEDPKSLLARDLFVRETGVYLFFLKNQTQLDLNLLQNMKLFFGFYVQSEEGPKISKVVAMYPRVFNEKETFIKKENLKFLKIVGPSVLDHVKEFYTSY